MTPTDCKKAGKCSLAVCPENREEMQMLMGTSNFCHTPWISRRLPKGVYLSEKAMKKNKGKRKDLEKGSGKCIRCDYVKRWEVGGHSMWIKARVKD